MKKKGFTLIELLAVIVVLAIIALIATPIVMNTIKKSKKGAAERSADSFVKQVETTVETERLSGNIMEDGEYEITSDGNLCKDKSASCSDDQKIKIEMSGTKPTSGKVKITNGVAQISTKLTVGDYDITYNTESKKYEASEIEKLCKAVTTATTGNVPNGSFNYGDEYICNLGDTSDSKNLTFFVLSKTDSEVSLIMNKNLGISNVGWCDDETLCKYNGYYWTHEPLVANSVLETRTENWNKITDKSKIALPTATQIATASGKSYNGYSVFGLPMWLYDYMKGTTHPKSSEYGYWTDSTTNCIVSSSGCDPVALNVSYEGNAGGRDFTNYKSGIRPVITISKSQLG